MVRRVAWVYPDVSTHSRPKAADLATKICILSLIKFQHTAARRRLNKGIAVQNAADIVSTHSRPKAADVGNSSLFTLDIASTHSRPKAAEYG